jgi:hypothetical protein
LAECSQAVAVDVAAAAEAYARLIGDAELRRRMGAAGRQRAVEHIRWERVIRAYEALWQEQERERRAFAAQPRPARALQGPARYPAPDHAFAGYPTVCLRDADLLEAAEGAGGELNTFLSLPLTSHATERRCRDAAVLQSILSAATRPRSVAELDDWLRRGGVTPEAGRATLAWMLKYGLLRVARQKACENVP